MISPKFTKLSSHLNNK